MGQLLFGRTQDASGTPFEPNRNPQYGGNSGPSGITSLEVQSAIEEAKATAKGVASRYNLFFGWDGSANTGRWLEQFKGVPSNNSPFIVAEKSIVRTLSIAVGSNATATVGLFRNAVLLTTISLSASRIASISGLNLVLNVGDTLSARPTSGTVSKPAFNIGIQVTT